MINNEKAMKNIEKCMKIKERSTKINENPWHANGHEQDPEQDVTRLREQDPEQGIYKKPVVTLSVKNNIYIYICLILFVLLILNMFCYIYIYAYLYTCWNMLCIWMSCFIYFIYTYVYMYTDFFHTCFFIITHIFYSSGFARLLCTPVHWAGAALLHCYMATCLESRVLNSLLISCLQTVDMVQAYKLSKHRKVDANMVQEQPAKEGHTQC